jgi:hypothetical protein
VHILTPIASVRRIVNMVALAVVEAQTQPLWDLSGGAALTRPTG